MVGSVRGTICIAGRERGVPRDHFAGARRPRRRGFRRRYLDIVVAMMLPARGSRRGCHRPTATAPYCPGSAPARARHPEQHPRVLHVYEQPANRRRAIAPHRVGVAAPAAQPTGAGIIPTARRYLDRMVGRRRRFGTHPGSAPNQLGRSRGGQPATVAASAAPVGSTYQRLPAAHPSDRHSLAADSFDPSSQPARFASNPQSDDSTASIPHPSAAERSSHRSPRRHVSRAAGVRRQSRSSLRTTLIALGERSPAA